MSAFTRRTVLRLDLTEATWADLREYVASCTSVDGDCPLGLDVVDEGALIVGLTEEIA